jgi:hypothetical protein
MMIERRRGRPRGYPKKKLAVLRAIADEAVGSSDGSFVLAPAVRRALSANGCYCRDSDVRDHSRSYRKMETALLDAARKRRCPPPAAPVRAPASYAGSVMADHVHREMGLAAPPVSRLAQLGMLNGFVASSPMLEFIRKHAVDMKSMHDKLHPALAIVRDMNKQQSETQRFIKSMMEAVRPFSRADIFKI